MQKIKDFSELYLEQLRDRFNAAAQQAEIYPKLAGAVTDPDLKAALEADISANTYHLDTLRKIFADIGQSPEGEACEGTVGLIHEAIELLDYTTPGPIRDVGIAISVMHINHHDIAGFTGCITLSYEVGSRTQTRLLQGMLADEKRTDATMNKLIAHLLIIDEADN